MAETKGKVSADRLPPLDPRVPPRYVKRRKDGLITRWSTLFKSNLDNFEVYYRPGSDDAMNHAVMMRRFEAKRAMQGGDPLAGSSFAVSVDGSIIDDTAGAYN